MTKHVQELKAKFDAGKRISDDEAYAVAVAYGHPDKQQDKTRKFLAENASRALRLLKKVPIVR
jgi:hypothetical protein